MPPPNLYACVHHFVATIARKTAGAARTRSSLRPLFLEGEQILKTSGIVCREKVNVCLCFVIPGWSEGPDLRCAIAHRGISRFRVRCSASPRNESGYVFASDDGQAVDLRPSPRLTARQAGKNPSIKSGEEPIMPMRHRAIPAVQHFAKTIAACVTAAVLIGVPLSMRSAEAGDVPTFAVDATWPKPLPNNWIMGQVGGITADEQGHIWVLQRPRSLTDDEKAAALEPPRTKCCVPAPPVLEFDADGNLLRSWGGPGEGYQWFGNEHGIEVSGGFVWLTGNANDDSQILKFTPDGKFVLQIGKIAPAKG